jgi:hypothetical protein
MQRAIDSAGRLWAITCYFNPIGYQRRLDNYHTFRRRLTVPLVTVELSYQRHFDLEPDAAEILIQLRGQDVLWQKERLLNIALQALPPECDKVAWLDCDVVFTRDDWSVRASRRLDEIPLIQPFREAYEAAPGLEDEAPDLANPSGHSLAYFLSSGKAPADVLRGDTRLTHHSNCGLAWAARREVLGSQGFYDACVLGSGDRAMLCAAVGKPADAVHYLRMNQQWMAHYLAWAGPHYAAVGGAVGWMDGGLIHLWHGDLRRRQYQDRHQLLASFEFDPAADLALTDSGCWRWNSAKPDMHQAVKRYFQSRREDGEAVVASRQPALS